MSLYIRRSLPVKKRKRIRRGTLIVVFYGPREYASHMKLARVTYIHPKIPWFNVTTLDGLDRHLLAANTEFSAWERWEGKQTGFKKRGKNENESIER